MGTDAGAPGGPPAVVRMGRPDRLLLSGTVVTPDVAFEGDVLIVSSMDDLKAHAAEVKGRIVLFNAVFTNYGATVVHRSTGPAEAAKLGAAILHGPHVWNFAEIYSALDKVHGAERIESVDRLVAHLAAWLNDPDARARVVAAANGVVENLSGALERTLASLDPYLMQLQLQQRASHA